MAPKKFAAVGLQLIILILIASIARSQPPRTPPPLSALDTFAALNTVAAVPTTHSVSTAEQLWTALEEVSQRDLGILIAGTPYPRFMQYSRISHTIIFPLSVFIRNEMFSGSKKKN